MESIVLIFDDESFSMIKDGDLPITPFSHDQNLFQFGHLCLKRRLPLYISNNTEYFREGAVWQVSSIYPKLSFSSEAISFSSLANLILVNCHPQLYAWHQLPHARKVAIHPALYFVEMPYTYGAEQTMSLLLSIRHHIDFMIVQNVRMKEILIAIYGWLGGWECPDRILLGPLGIVKEQIFDLPDRSSARQILRCASDEIAIVNGGGVWRWTGFNDFLRGFIQAVRGGAEKLVLYTTGFRQTENTDHGDYIAETRRLLAENADLVGDRLGCSAIEASRIKIHVEEDWRAASVKIPTFLAGADLGLNVNQSGLENWQAQRVRCLEYIKFGLPLLSTPGDGFSDLMAGGAVVRLPSLAPNAVAKRLAKIAAQPQSVVKARTAAGEARVRIGQNSSMSDAIDTILATPKRQPNLARTTTLESIRQNEVSRIEDEVAKRLAALSQ